MYYSSGNYEAFARPQKPKDVEHKSAYIIGTGLAALTAACYLVRDGQMPGSHIHIFEKDPIPGGACDGYEFPGLGYVMRGGREMDNHFEVMWDLYRSIPSIETEGVSTPSTASSACAASAFVRRLTAVNCPALRSPVGKHRR